MCQSRSVESIATTEHQHSLTPWRHSDDNSEGLLILKKSAQNRTAGKVVLRARDSGRWEDERRLLARLGYSVTGNASSESGGAEDPVDLILVFLEDNEDDCAMLAKLPAGKQAAPPVLVFGPATGSEWRRSALRAGAFACASAAAPVEDRIALLSAASRYNAAQIEIRMLREETELVVQGLLESFGSEAASLRKVTQEAENVRKSFEEVQNRIIRSML